MRIQNHSPSIQQSNSFPSSVVSQNAQEQIAQKQDGFRRSASNASMSQSLRGSSAVDSNSTEGQIQSLFKEQFAAKAGDQKEFHAFMKEVFGDNYDFSKAEAYRRSALAGDFNWLPPIQFASDAELGGANGAYSAETGVVYINEKLKNNIPLAAQTFVEEAGHHLDAKLNKSDTAGDEGELFRRLMGNESLSAAQIKDIKTENDKGTIVVDGKEIEVEFWNPFKAIGKAAKSVGKAVGNAAKSVGKAVGNAAKSVGKAIGGAAKSVGKAIGSVAKGVGSVAVGMVKGTVDGVGGFFKNLFKGNVGDAFGALWQGFDKGFLQAPAKLANSIFNAADHLTNALGNLLEPIGLKKAVNFVGSRLVDVARNITNTGLGIARDIITTPIEAGAGFIKDNYEGFKSLFKGDFKDAFKNFGMAYVNAGGRLIGGAVDVTMRAVASAASAIGTLIGLEPPSRPLTDEEKAWFREVYGDSIDLDVVRVKQGGLVTLGASKCVGNTVYLSKDCFDSNGNLNNRGVDTLAHEVAHVWQNQNGGGDYIHKALASQAWSALTGGSRNGAYNWREGMNNGKDFTDLNPEQQGTLIEEVAMAMRNGSFVQSEYTAQEWAYMQAALVDVRAGNAN